MRLGLFMMPLHPSYRAIADCYDRDIDQLVLADKLGFDEAWLGEHFTEIQTIPPGITRACGYSPKRLRRELPICAE
ncbi:MAG: LLM class flavin-dependent oxidoreductase [Betaproteobacteria bacterium]|nr:LLM class flavin-dependent oxidoreductase [Betaproteobacteria bacterium]